MNRYAYYAPHLLVYVNHPPWHREVLIQLDRVKQTVAGRNVFAFISNGRKAVRLLPFRPTNKDPVNAYARTDLSANDADAHAKGSSLFVPVKVPFGGGRQIMLPTQADYGTGAGADTVVEYSPATWLESNRRSGRIAPGEGPAEVLIHELTHAMRMGHGLFYDTTVWGHLRMDDYEEFCSILVANVYRSERGFTLMRANHWGSGAIKKLTHDEDYYNEFKTEIDRWFDAQPWFCRAMAIVSAKFNPFRAAAVSRGLKLAFPFLP